METIKIGNKSINIDIVTELSPYFNINGNPDKIIAPSPFRDDKTPSFFVNITGKYAGGWRDSGAIDSEWESGNLVKLLAFLRNETLEETSEYIYLSYGVELRYDELELDTPSLTLRETHTTLPDDYLTPFRYKHSYLTNRGVSERVQRMMRIGYDRERDAVVIPWIDDKGRIANCKFRSTRSKIFWYAKGAIPVKQLLYGMDVISNVKPTRAVICEAEIDALTWMTWGIPAVAIGGSHFTDKQVDIIKRSSIVTLVISADNDGQGRKLREAIVCKLSGYVELEEVIYPSGYKDVNEILVDGLEMPKTESISPLKINL